MSGEGKDGYPIVLTASRAEMSSYESNPFRAFICTFPEAISRRVLGRYLKTESNPDGTAQFAPYGLRKIEAMLIEEFGEENVVTVGYEHLHRFVGKDTKLVGISTMDPMGLAYVSTTYNTLIGFGGPALNAVEFKRLMQHPVFRKYRPKILVGGAGVWQIRDSGKQEEFGIDVLFQGEGENDAVEVVRRLMNNEPVPSYFRASRPDHSYMPLIKRPASYGMVEITRGCGRGCKFCSITMRKKYSAPVERVMKEVEVNIRGGADTIFTATDDMFLYHSRPGFIPDREAIVRLYSSIANYPGVNHILLSHASIAPILYEPEILDDLTPILMEKTPWTPENNRHYRQPFITVEVGIETGSVRLMKNNMPGKALPFSVENWPELVVEGIGRFNDHDWWPLCTFMTGQPDETEDDVIATLELLDELKAHNAKMFYTPLVFIPLEDAVFSQEKRPNLENLTELQWEVVTRSWRYNIEFWRPDLRWILGPIFFLSHWFYARWRHGRKATVPMMHLAGFPGSVVKLKVGRECDLDYCKGPTASPSQRLRWSAVGSRR